MLKSETPCYVYTYTSSLSGKVFYVGRGSSDRYLQHIREALRGNLKKLTFVVQAIRAIWQQGGKVIIRKVQNGIPHWDSVILEQQLIVHYGYEQLVNVPHYKTCRCKPEKDVLAVLSMSQPLS